MSDAIDSFYKNELWYIMYNNAISAININDVDTSIELLLLATKIDPTNAKSHIMLSKVYKMENRYELSQQSIENALAFDSLDSEQRAELYLVKAEILKEMNDYDNAIQYNEMAYHETKSIHALIELLNLNLLTEKNFKAIEWAEIVYEEFYLIDEAFKPNVLFNIGLAYRYVATHHYDLGVDVIEQLNNNEDVSITKLKECENNLKIAYEHFELSREYFLESHDEATADEDDPDETDASIRADQTKDYMKQIEKILIPFIEEEKLGINLQK